MPMNSTTLDVASRPLPDFRFKLSESSEKTESARRILDFGAKNSLIFNRMDDIGTVVREVGLANLENISLSMPMIPQCKSDDEIILTIINECYHNPLFAAKWLLNQDLMPFQGVIFDTLWNRRYPFLLASRGAGKSYIYAVYALLRAILIPESKIVLVSSSFRQAKLVFDYMRQIWDKSPVLRQIAGGDGPRTLPDCCRLIIGRSIITAIPIGDGEKIRGLRSNCTLVDEFASVPEEIFKVVIWGFSAVSMNPNERIRQLARDNWKLTDADMDGLNSGVTGNQVILSGTANYRFNHSYTWYKNYEKIISAHGDKAALCEMTGIKESDYDETMFDWQDFAILRIPYYALPKGHLDPSTIINAKINMAQELFEMEYGCKFIDDTRGFIPMSLIQSSTFGLTRIGCNETCVMGIDPARSSDNLAIVIAKIVDKSRAELIYCWSFNEKRMKEEYDCESLPKLGFYFLAAMKMLDLIKKFNIKLICMDPDGGGAAIKDILFNPALSGIPASFGNKPIVALDEENPPEGAIRMIKFEKFAPNFINDANYNFKKDIETKNFTFPKPNVEGAAQNPFYGKNEDKAKLYNLLDDEYALVNDEVEKMKREIATVKIYQTDNGTKHFDTGKGGTKPKKDRYTAAFLCDAAYRSFINGILEDNVEFIPMDSTSMMSTRG